MALKADRLSYWRLLANQFRLLVHAAAAYWLLEVVLRSKKLVAGGGGGVERMQLDTRCA